MTLDTSKAGVILGVLLAGRHVGGGVIFGIQANQIGAGRRRTVAVLPSTGLRTAGAGVERLRSTSRHRRASAKPAKVRSEARGIFILSPYFL